jgi:hypothetical protein
MICWTRISWYTMYRNIKNNKDEPEGSSLLFFIKYDKIKSIHSRERSVNKVKNYHCCATCNHFKVEKDRGTTYLCKRLGFETSPKYQFNCWDPRENIKKKIESEG